MKNLFTVITVCKNSEQTIARTISSVINQTYSNLELIIVDGKSTDSTLEIISSFKDERIRLICEPDSGIYNAMNKGISQARGSIISILNSDDFYSPDALEYVNNEFLNNSSIGILCADVYIIHKSGSVSIMKARVDKLKDEMVPHPGVFMRKDAQNINIEFREDLRIAADYDLLLRNYSNGVKIERFKVPIAFYSEGGFSDSPANRMWSTYETLEVQRANFPTGVSLQRMRFLWNTIGTVIKRDQKLKMLHTLLVLARDRRFF